MGAAGVMIAAAGAHGGGGDLSRTAAEFLLIHAGVVVAVTAAARSVFHAGGWIVLVAASVLAAGTIAFSADLAILALLTARPFPAAAPIGGLGMVAGWLLIGVGALRALLAFGMRRP